MHICTHPGLPACIHAYTNTQSWIKSEGTPWNCIRGGLVWVLGKQPPEGSWALEWTPHWSWSQDARVTRAFGQLFQHRVWILGGVQAAVRLNDTCESLPTQGILSLYILGIDTLSVQKVLQHWLTMTGFTPWQPAWSFPGTVLGGVQTRCPDLWVFNLDFPLQLCPCDFLGICRITANGLMAPWIVLGGARAG